MRYRIKHSTTYNYESQVSVCHNQAYLSPRNTNKQRCFNYHLHIQPTPAVLDQRSDLFGNQVTYFALQVPHKKLTVTAYSEVQTEPANELPDSPAWESVRDHIAWDSGVNAVEVKPFVLASPFVEPQQALYEYAQVSFSAQRPLLLAVQDLTQRIYTEFAYDPHFTTVVTPLSEVLEHRRGVCQDFAHLALAGVRAMGLAARYVSGYLETQPPPGEKKLAGADASHAWFSVYVPDLGWYDFDPTNNQRSNASYITTAWGRDYGDVTPLKGVIFGGGEHHLDVAVDVIPLP